MEIERILIVDRSQSIHEFVKAALSEWTCQVRSSLDGTTALAVASEWTPDLVLVEQGVAATNWAAWITRLRELAPSVLIVLMRSPDTSQPPSPQETESAFTFLFKPLNREALLLALDQAGIYSQVLTENRLLIDQLAVNNDIPLVAESSRMRRMLEEAQRVASSSCAVLIQGESGTEKAPVARFIHSRSQFSAAPLVRCACKTNGAHEAETKLFGCKSTVNNARHELPGQIHLAQDGTLFIDDIEFCSMDLQAKLLRLLEEGCYFANESTVEEASRMRIICSSSTNLHEEMSRGRFRKDLFFRLSESVLSVPPLRERPEDIGPLAAHFIAESRSPASALTKDALDQLAQYDWPGNVEELRSALLIALLRQENQKLQPEMLPIPSVTGSAKGNALKSLAEVERSHVLHAIQLARGDMTRAAGLLQISKSDLSSRLRNKQKPLGKHGRKTSRHSSVPLSCSTNRK